MKHQCNCSHCVVIGGPNYSTVTCDGCGKEWERYFLGSWDWEYRDCSSCMAKRVWDSLKEEDKDKISEAIKNFNKKQND